MQAVPHPRAFGSRWPFTVGAVGHFIAASFAVPFGVIALFAVAFPIVLSIWYPFSIALAGTLFLQTFGYYGLWREYRVGLALAAFAAGVVASIFLLALGVFANVSCDGPYYICYRSNPALALFLPAVVCLGATAILDGAALLAIRPFLIDPEEARIGGILCIISGGLLASVVFAFFGGFFVLAAALTMGGVVVWKTPLRRVPSFAPTHASA